MNNEEIKQYAILLNKEIENKHKMKIDILDRIKEIEICIENRLWQSALTMSLTLPDICAGNTEGNNEKLYKKWIKNEMVESIKMVEYIPFKDESDIDMTAEYILYKIRCSIIHDGNKILKAGEHKHNPYQIKVDFSINTQSKYIVARNEKSNSRKEGYIEKEYSITINIPLLCKLICEKTRKYLENNKKALCNSLEFEDYI